MQKNSSCQTLQHSCTPEFTKAGTICKRPARGQASPILSIDGEGADEVLFLAERLLATDGYWKRGSLFSSGIWFLRSYQCSVDSPIPMNIEVALNVFTQWVFFFFFKESSEGKVVWGIGETSTNTKLACGTSS